LCLASVAVKPFEFFVVAQAATNAILKLFVRYDTAAEPHILSSRRCWDIKNISSLQSVDIHGAVAQVVSGLF